MKNDIKPPVTGSDNRNAKKRTPDHAEKRKKQLSLLLSIAIAIVVWGFVIQTENPVTQLIVSNVSVKLQNEAALTAKGLAISGERNFEVKVVIEGKRTDVFSTKQSSIEASVDLSACAQGQNLVSVAVFLPGGAKVRETVPARILIDVEPLVTVSKPVKAEYSGQLKPENIIGDISISPDNIEITGPETEVADVKYLKAIVPYEQITTGGNTIKAGISPIGSDGELVDNVKLANDYVYVTARLDVVKTVPLLVEVVGRPGDYYELQSSDIPNSIVVEGPASEINNLTHIKAENIDISNLTSSTRIVIKPKFPDGISAAPGSSSLYAVFNIVELDRVEFEFDSSEILFENLEENLEPLLSEADIKVTVIGKSDVIGEIKKESVVLFVDCSGLDLMTTDLPISFKTDKNVSAVLTNPTSIGISVINN